MFNSWTFTCLLEAECGYLLIAKMLFLILLCCYLCIGIVGVFVVQLLMLFQHDLSEF